eukprot:362304-Chlamydomonas_euryale.AAC.6
MLNLTPYLVHNQKQNRHAGMLLRTTYKNNNNAQGVEHAATTTTAMETTKNPELPIALLELGCHMSLHRARVTCLITEPKSHV